MTSQHDSRPDAERIGPSHHTRAVSPDNDANSACAVEALTRWHTTPAEINRGIFREMIRGLIEDNQLNRRTQREAIQFAQQLNISAADAVEMIAEIRRGRAQTLHSPSGCAMPTPTARVSTASCNAGPTDESAVHKGLTGVAVTVLLLNAAWFWYVLYQ